MKHNDKKIGKIIDELTVYLLKKGIHNIDINIDYTMNAYKITFKVERLSEKMTELLDETLHQEHDESIEEYGWELLGENDCSCELNLIGICIDDCIIDHQGEYTIITMEKGL